jgi:hypothetical protein
MEKQEFEEVHRWEKIIDVVILRCRHMLHNSPLKKLHRQLIPGFHVFDIAVKNTPQVSDTLDCLRRVFMS